MNHIYDNYKINAIRQQLVFWLEKGLTIKLFFTLYLSGGLSSKLTHLKSNNTKSSQLQ